MIWTQHQADLISEIYSLLEAPSAPSSPQRQQASTSDHSQTHRRNTSDASASSDEDRSPRLQKSNSMLKSLVGTSDINDTAFLLGDLGKMEADFNRSNQGSLQRSDARSLRTTSAIYAGDTPGTTKAETGITPPRKRRHSAMRRILPPSLLPRSSGSLTGDVSL